jgi:hypothetical protein
MQNVYEDEETCQELVPAKIRIYSAHFTGATVAECKRCNFLSAYFECACDLEHNCNEYKN